ncbi:glycosyltransferase family 2 protein [Crateriforma spongiae]|uniref:glycosyltransferase family 2 protein n=1 Tax=Crateriforma spongiae TaxID=2724528 RepID=UPI0039B0894F
MSSVGSKIAVIVLTKDEELHLRRALVSVDELATETFVVDSFSTDSTASIAMECNASVLMNKFVNQAKQFEWAMGNAPITSDWVLRLDADEVIEPDLQQEILRRLPELPDDVVGVNFKRKHIFMDRWVRHGGRYPLVMTRLFRRGHGRVEDRWMDEHIVVSGGRTVTFEGGFADHNLNDLSYFIDKHNKYASREAMQVLGTKYGLFETDDELSSQSSSFQASFKRFVKEKIYNRIPFTISSTAYFLYRYIFQLGFLDGRSGLVYHFLQGYWYRFLVGAKVMELEKAIDGMTDKQEICRELSRRTGLQLTPPESEPESASGAPSRVRETTK